MPLGEGVRSPAPAPGIVQGAAFLASPSLCVQKKVHAAYGRIFAGIGEELGHYMFSSLRTAGEFTISDANKLNPGFRS